MPFTASPMFPGDLYDTADRMANSAAPLWSRDRDSTGSPRWAQILELGWQGVLVAEDAGGVGATLAEFAAIAEAAGRNAMGLPLVARCVVAPVLLASAGAHAGVQELLAKLSAGEASVCPVLQQGGNNALQATQAKGGGITLHGVLRGADLTEPANYLVFNACDADAAIASAPLLLLLMGSIWGTVRLVRFARRRLGNARKAT